MRQHHIRMLKIPNEIVFEEVTSRIERGEPVVINFVGNSMAPILRSGKVKIRLIPIAGDRQPKLHDVVLFRYAGRHILHRIVKVDNEQYTMQGDACIGCEKVMRKDIVALLDAVIYPDGHEISTQSDKWRRKSARSLMIKNIRNTAIKLFGKRQRRWESVLYIVLLLFLMWAPLNGVGIDLNNFVFGIRADHLIHSSVYIPAALFLMDWCKKRKILTYIASILLGITTETVQYLLPYRGFDINDMAANFIGASLGWAIIFLFIHKSNNTRL